MSPVGSMDVYNACYITGLTLTQTVPLRSLLPRAAGDEVFQLRVDYAVNDSRRCADFWRDSMPRQSAGPAAAYRSTLRSVLNAAGAAYGVSVTRWARYTRPLGPRERGQGEGSGRAKVSFRPLGSSLRCPSFLALEPHHGCLRSRVGSFFSWLAGGCSFRCRRGHLGALCAGLGREGRAGGSPPCRSSEAGSHRAAQHPQQPHSPHKTCPIHMICSPAPPARPPAPPRPAPPRPRSALQPLPALCAARPTVPVWAEAHNAGGHAVTHASGHPDPDQPGLPGCRDQLRHYGWAGRQLM